jgi:DNA modification methylase
MKIHCLYDDLKDPATLSAHPKNRNKHPKEQIERLAKILEYQGWRYPVKISKRSLYITSGHGRVEAALSMGWDQVPVQYQDYESDEQEYSDVQSDNAIASWAELDLSAINQDVGDLGPDFDIDLLGIEDFVIEPADKLDPQCDEDEVPEKVEPKTKLGDIYKLGNHRLMCGDSTSIDAVEKLIGGETIDLVYTDPPYGISIVEMGGVFKEYKKVLGDDSIHTAIDAYNVCISKGIQRLIFWGGNYYSSFLTNSKCWIVWDKQGGKHLTYADCELAWSNLDSVVRMFTHIWPGFRKSSEVDEKRVHPTQKPVALAESIFTLMCEDSKSVLDLFGGSGSTLIACEKTNRKCFMMELDPYYCDVIVARWEKYTGKKAELVNG